MDYKLAEHPFVELILRALLRLAYRYAQSLKLSLVERVGQVVEQILRAASASLADAALVLTEHVCKDLHLRPYIVVDEPFHEMPHGSSPRLVVQCPEQASSLPCRDERTFGDVPKDVVVGKVGKRSHVGSKLVGKAVERLNNEPSLADGKPSNIFVEFFVKIVTIFALAWNAPVASLARLVREYHTSEGAVEQFLLIELACGEGSRADSDVGTQNGIARNAVGCGTQSTRTLAVVYVAHHLRDLPVPATHAVCHLHLGHVDVLGALPQLLASHGVLYEGCVGDIGGWKPESHIGSDGFLLVGALRLHQLLPLHQLRQLLLVVSAEVAAEGFHKS